MAGVEEMCRVRDAHLLFAHMPVDAQYDPLEVPRLVMDRACDGLIVIGAHLSRSTAALPEDGPAAVLVDAYAEGADLDAVVSDNAAGCRYRRAKPAQMGMNCPARPGPATGRRAPAPARDGVARCPVQVE